MCSELARLRVIYPRFSAKNCALMMDRASYCIISKANENKIKPTFRVRTLGKLYAEDIANLMELRHQGYAWKSIGKCYPEFKVQSLMRAVSLAKREGFDAYPKRHWEDLT